MTVCPGLSPKRRRAVPFRGLGGEGQPDEMTVLRNPNPVDGVDISTYSAPMKHLGRLENTGLPTIPHVCASRGLPDQS